LFYLVIDENPLHKVQFQISAEPQINAGSLTKRGGAFISNLTRFTRCLFEPGVVRSLAFNRENAVYTSFCINFFKEATIYIVEQRKYLIEKITHWS